jgi:hypothetical protein
LPLAMMPKRSLRALDHVVVELVGAHIGQRRVPLVVHQARFLLQRRVGPADVQAAGRHDKVLGQDDLHAVRVHLTRWRDDSTTSWMVFMPLHTPEKRLMAKACRPMSRMSCTLLGKNTGSAAGLEDVVALVRGGAALG